MNKTHSGGCLCGDVRFKTSGVLKEIVCCHCTECRKQTGHFLASTESWQKDLEVLEDKGLKWFNSSDHSRRGFCKNCGSVLFFETDGQGIISIMMGAFDEPTGLKMAAHIFMDEKGDYYDVEPDVKHIAQGDHGIALPAKDKEK